MRVVGGIDAGSRTIKAVLYDAEGGQMITQGACDQGLKQSELASALLLDLLEQQHLVPADLLYTVATGYGRNAIAQASETRTEISCHALGVRALMPDVRTIIDIGGQDSKLIRLDDNGKMTDFVMNDRCAAGTGRFLEVVAERLQLPLHEIGRIKGGNVVPVTISSMCVVFAETEIVSLMASGIPAADIAAGVRKAIAARVATMAGRSLASPVALTGGVALLEGMAGALADVLGVAVTVPPHPRFTGALGAALLAAEKSEQNEHA